MASTLAGAGATVAVTARRRERLDALADSHPSIHPFPADLAEASQREALAREIERQLGPIDILVNNAGAAHPAPIEQETLEDFTRSMELNLVAAWHLSKLVGVPMAARGDGSIVNIASVLGLVGGTPVKESGYAAAKGAVVNLTRELALQWSRRGVRVNVICPGWFATEMTEDMLDSDRGASFIAENTPMQRAGHPHELDGALLLLASAAGSFMTGSVLVVDGGWTAR